MQNPAVSMNWDITDERVSWITLAYEDGRFERFIPVPENGIVDYVQIVQDTNDQYRVRARSDNGDIIWTTEQYGDWSWALAIALDSGKPLKQEDHDADTEGTPEDRTPDEDDLGETADGT